MKTNRTIFTLFFCCVLFIVFYNIPATASQSQSQPRIISITPDENWIPDDQNICSITVTCENMPGNSSIDFQLHSTNWPGYCMNAGFAQYGIEPNITLTWVRHSNDAITVSWGNVAPTKFILWVRSYDYGSVGKINARACIGADPRNPERKLYVTNDCMIPKYSQQTPYIAEAQLDESGWEGFTGGPGADTETGPGNNMNSGDGLTAFEEYRGFVITGGSSQRLSPLKRDVFVYSDFTEGIGWAEYLPDVFNLWIIDKTGMEDFEPNPTDGSTARTNQRINFLACEDFHYLNQRALWVQKGGTKSGGLHTPDAAHYGFTQHSGSTRQGPARINYIKVYEGNIETDVNGLTYDPNLTNQQLAKLQNDSIKRAINWAIGHEIGHALGAEHFDGIGPIREDPNKTGASIMRSYVNVQSRTTVDNIGDPIYYTVPETVIHGSHHYLPRHDTEYKLVPDGVSLTSPETASESRPLPNFPMLSLDPSKFPNDASCGGTLVAPPNDQSTDTVPPPPTGLSLSAGNGQVSLSLTGGSGTITDYQYRYRVSGGSWSSWISAGLVTLFDVLGLTNGTTYEFEVRAMNGQQASAAIASSFGVTPATVPGAPTIWRADSGDGQVNLSWTVPSDDGGSEITDYEYQYRESNGGTWRLWTSFRVISTSEDVAGLTNGTEYEFRVRAVNRVGGGSESNTLTATPLLPPPPIVVRPPTAPTETLYRRE